MWTNHPSSCTHNKTLDYKISDHRILTTSIPGNWQQPVLRCIIRQDHHWSCPPGYTMSEWKAHIDSIWQKWDKTNLSHHLDPHTGVFNQQRVDDTWQLFTSTIHYSKAAATAKPPHDSTQAEAFSRWQQHAAAAAPKQLTPDTQYTPYPHTG